MAKLANRPPGWGGNGEARIDTEEIVGAIEGMGFQTGACRCGCGPNDMKNCVAVYVLDDGSVDHVAVFDPRTCDWVAKNKAARPIERYRMPTDYIACADADAAPVTLKLYCKEGPPPAYPDDGDLHRRASRF